MKFRLLFVVFVIAGLNFPFAPSFANAPYPAEVANLAENGDPASQYELGRMYQGGRGVPQDYTKAVEWYRKSAERGYAPAEASLVAMYAGGYGGLPEDHEQAKKWFEKAAEQGNSSAKFGLFLENSLIVHFIRSLPQGYRDAIFWTIIIPSVVIGICICVLFVVMVARAARKFKPRFRR